MCVQSVHIACVAEVADVRSVDDGRVYTARTPTLTLTLTTTSISDSISKPTTN